MSARRALRTGGLWFDGKTAYVQIPAMPFSYPMTICLWVKPFDGGRRHYVYASKSGDDGWGLEDETHVSQFDGYFSFFSKTNGVTHVDKRSIAPVTADWHFISVVLDSTYRFYLNSSLVDSVAIVGTPDFSTYDAVTYIGRPVTSVRFMYGIIDDVRIYNRALSKDEIKAIYERDELIKDGLVLYLDFSEYEGNIAYDKSGYNNHGIIYGGARWVIKKALRVLPSVR
ncbi:MAG: LamG domain-containing protein [Thermofilaceae archaeon]